MALRGKFWQFSKDGREFSITRRDLDQPWRNYLSTDHFNTVLTHTGEGAAYGRSVWADWVQDESSPRLVFMRDRDTGKQWTINGTDTKRQPKAWKCTHGFGYTTISSVSNNVENEVTYFLPLDESVELWRIRVVNLDLKPRKLSIFPIIKWSLGNKGHEKMYDNVHFENNTILAESYLWPFLGAPRNSLPEFNRNWDRIGFMTSDIQATGYDCELSAFTGGGSPLQSPVIENGACTNSLRRGVPSCGVLQLDIALAAGESRDVVVMVGAAKDRKDVKRIVTKLGTIDRANEAFENLRRWWDEYLDRMHVETPDPDITTFANGWNRYALYIRYYYRHGYRDTAQDMGTYIAFDTERFHKRTAQLLEAQFRRGNTYHDVAELGFPQHVTYNSDPPAWLPWLVTSYVKETGDFGYLKQKFSYQDGAEASVYDHLVRALHYYEGESGRHGLPLIKCGDWNDCLMGSSEKGVSVWLAEFLYISYDNAAEMATRMGKNKDAQHFRSQADALAKAINEHCWDGSWYIRAMDNEGKPIGARSNTQGKIFLNAQSWAVISGVAPTDRAEKAMKSVERMMETPVGLPLVSPPYSKIEPRIGLLSRIAPGRHHLGVWNHANTWAIIADCMVGRPDHALETYRKTFPPYLSQNFDLHTSEPYVHASYTNIPISGETGRTGVGWNTGTVCWMYRALFEGFAGVRPEWDGLRIAPSLPSEWKTMSVKRDYRENTFHISIENSSKNKAKKIKQVFVDGEEIEGNLIPSDPDKIDREVKIVMS